MNKESIVHPIKFKKSKAFWVFVIVASLALKVGSGIFVASKVPGVQSKFGDILAMVSTPVPYVEPGSSYELPSAKWIPQTFNNCGPAATSMVLQYFGFNVSQEETKAHLRTNPDDKNVFMGEISAYLKNDYGIENKVFINGDLKTIKTLIANGIYVVVEDFLHPNEDIGHVLIIRGFDDTARILIADDSYFGVGQKYPYKAWDETQWKPYNREYMPLYPHEKEAMVKSIIGENWDESKMYQNSVLRNQKDVDSNPNDMYAYFNLGVSFYHLGEYEKAKNAFEKSQNLGWPKRILWYFIEPVENYNKLVEYQKAIDTANLGLWYNDNFAEMHFEKYIAFKGLGDLQNAEVELQKAISLDANITKKL